MRPSTAPRASSSCWIARLKAGCATRNRLAAREQIRLAQDRYRLGSGSSLEVSDAQNTVARAEGDYVNAVYDYHKAITALEAAVGRPLR